MVVAVLTNGCRRFDQCLVAVLTTIVAVLVVAVLACRRVGLSPCWLVAVLVVAVLDLSPFWLSPFRLVAVLTCIPLHNINPRPRPWPSSRSVVEEFTQRLCTN